MITLGFLFGWKYLLKQWRNLIWTSISHLFLFWIWSISFLQQQFQIKMILFKSISQWKTSTPQRFVDETRVFKFRMFNLFQEDQYAYIQYELPDEELYIGLFDNRTFLFKDLFYLVGYSPLVNMNSAHHMLTYPCERPSSNEPYWWVD